MTWGGLGVNHKSPAKIVSDAAYFKTIGVNKVRAHLPPISNSAAMAQWLAVAKQWYDLGFYTIYGGSVLGGTGSAADWSTYRTNILAYATTLAAGERKMTEFQIGNELELRVDGTTLTQTQLRTNLRSLGAEVKAILPEYTISYTTSFYQDYSSWASEGIAGLDKLGINVYGNISTSGGRWTNSYMVNGKLATIYSALGSSVYISEFGIDASSANLDLVSDNQKAVWMRQILKDIKNSGIPSAYVYMYRGYLDQNNNFALVYTDDSHTAAWNVLEQNNGRLSKS